MATTAVDTRIKFYLFLWYGVVTVLALMLGAMLASDQITLALMVAGAGWLVTLPYHARVSLYLATATFSSAFIVPMLSGRPFMWEIAALLAWTGVIITAFLRQFPEDTWAMLRRNHWVIWGALGYCLVLLVTMGVRGVGFRILGSGQVGGRFYLQQILCAIFPLLFITCRIEERTFVRIYVLQWLLASSYLLSDFAFSIAPGQLGYLLEFLELPTDAINFERQSMMFRVRRFQSFAYLGQAVFFVLLVFNSLRDFVGRRGLWLLPLSAASLAVGLLSGHRWVVLIVGLSLVFVAIAQRFFTVRNVSIILFAASIGVVGTYAVVDHLPLPVQRAVSFLPGIQIDTQAEWDAASTLWVRKVMFQLGLTQIPQYFWIGTGFARYLDDYSMAWDPTTVTFHLNQGKFYNGFIGLMVNTGVFGTISMLLFIAGGLRIAVGIIRHVRRYGFEDHFSRAAILVASFFIASVIGFLFLHGDSEWAMKTFSLQTGLLLLCQRAFRERLEHQEPPTT